MHNKANFPQIDERMDLLPLHIVDGQRAELLPARTLMGITDGLTAILSGLPIAIYEPVGV